MGKVNRLRSFVYLDSLIETHRTLRITRRDTTLVPPQRRKEYRNGAALEEIDVSGSPYGVAVFLFYTEDSSIQLRFFIHTSTWELSYRPRLIRFGYRRYFQGARCKTIASEHRKMFCELRLHRRSPCGLRMHTILARHHSSYDEKEPRIFVQSGICLSADFHQHLLLCV